MRGRTQAIGVSVVSAVLPFLQWLSTSVVSLVVLRHGLAEGSLVLMWAALPMIGVYFLVGDLTPAILLFGTVALAYTLRATVSWEMTLLASVVLAGVGGLLFELTAAGLVDEAVGLYMEVLQQAKAQLNDQQAAAFVLPTADAARSVVLGFVTMGYAVSMLICLGLARWWQSVLYNPGGFQEEFHQIRLSPMVSAGLVFAVLVCFSIEGLNRWVQVLTVPLIVAGLGFVHWFIKEKQLSGSWLVSLYIIVILLRLFPMLAFLALMDSWFDLRKKIRTNEV
jgi:hypothetical protein